jgi:AraC family transcriptional regulator, regulatory protein of adaptative response / DNA-3-methyladenine glycosylase II
VFTPWPPGPLDRENRQRNSAAGTVTRDEMTRSDTTSGMGSIIPPGRPAAGVSGNRTTSPASEIRQHIVVRRVHARHMLTEDACYRALSSRDSRFDGWFFAAVLTTGIYCRPSCPAMTPKRANVRFLPTAAAAQEAGFRACKRCRPDAAPGSPEWNVRADLVGRAMRHIADGVVDREGVAGLARRLGYSERHLHRQLVAELGAGPIALARAQRSQAARLLLETTDVPIAAVAIAAGFASVRQFNDTVREVFALTPSQLRSSRRPSNRTPTPGALQLRLPFRRPFAPGPSFAFLATRAVPAIEIGASFGYRRTIGLAHGAGVIEVGDLTAGVDPTDQWVAQGWLPCRLELSDLRDLASAVSRCRRLLDLDADAQAVAEALGDDPLLRAAIAGEPGLRVTGHVDGFELAVRAVLGQQVSVAGARTLAGRLTTTIGEPAATTDGTLTHLFPTPQAIAAADPATLSLTRSRAAALIGLARAVADGVVDLEPGADRDRTTAQLLALPGIGPWTTSYIRMRALADPDVFMPTDLGVRHGLDSLGFTGDARDIETVSKRWRPWRSYALQHVWTAATTRRPATRLPEEKIA